MKINIVLLALFMLFKPVLPVIEYVVFYDYIKNELCVNKAEVALKCNGKCHLKKELAKASDFDKNKDKRFFSAELHLVFFEDASNYVATAVEVKIKKEKQFMRKLFYDFSWINAVFKPPSFLL